MINNFYQYGGKLHAHTPSYVKRFADGQLYELLKQNYFCYVFNCRQMGKSSLQAQVKMRLEATNAQENQCVYLSLQEMGVSQSSSENQWYRELSKKIFGELNLDKQADFKGCWSRFSGQGAVSSFSDFIVEVLLPLTSSNLVIFIDEIDKILELSFRDNFFGLIRAFHEKRAEYDDFNRLTFCFLGVATPNDLIQNPLQSPFNIGRAIELRGFEFNESLVLAQGLQDVASVPEEVLREILFWTGGQPFLTQKVCALLVESQVRIGEGQEKSFIEEFIYSSIIRNWEGQDDPSHLKDIKNRLLAKEILTGKLLEIYRHILQNGYFTTEGNQLESELRLSGLVVKRSADLEIFNPIYREVFSLEWVQKQLDSLRPYAVALNAWLASEKNNAYLLDETETARADIWREGKFLTREDEEFIRDSKLAQKDKESAQKIEAEREAKKILEKAKKKAQKALAGSIIASALIIAGTLVFAIIQTTKAERATQKADQAITNLTDAKRERDHIQQEIVQANQKLFRASAERRRIELNAHRTSQLLKLVQGNLNRLEIDRNQSQEQIDRLQSRKTTLERERQIILAQKQTAESRTRKSQEELNQVERDLQANLQQLEEIEKSLRVAEQARQTALRVTGLEQRGISIARRWDRGSEGQINLLLEAIKVGEDLQEITKIDSSNQYSSPALLLTLRTILDGIQEQNQFSGHRSSIKSVAFSPDGRYFATGSLDETARLWDLQGNLLAEFKGHGDDVKSIVFSPDGKYLATGSSDDTARLWDLKGNLLREFKSNSGAVQSVVFSPDGQYLVTGSWNTISLWDLQGNLIWKLQGRGHNREYVMSVAFSPDGKYIATGGGGSDKTARLWDLQGNLLRKFTGHKDGLIGVIFSHDGKYIATASSDKTARLWDFQGNLLVEFKGHGADVRSIAFSPDDQYLATGSWDNTARLWDLHDLAKFNDSKPNDENLSTFSHWERVSEYEEDDQVVMKLIRHPEIVESVAFSPDGKYLATGSNDNIARLWSLQSHFFVEFKGHKDNIESVAFSPDGKYLATGSSSNTAHLWDLQGNLIAEFKGHKDNVESVAFSPDGKYLATGSNDKTARLWDLKGNLLREFTGHKDDVKSVAFSPDGKYIATGSSNNTARLWDLKGNLLREFTGHKDDVQSVAFSPDGKYLATGSSNKTARLWDLKGNLLREFTVHKNDVQSVAFSPDGKYLATGSWDKTARLWDLQGNLIVEFNGHRSAVVSVAFSPDGKYLATGSNDNTARLWDLQGNILAEFKGHKDDVKSVAFSPDGKYLATGSNDKTVRLWPIEDLDALLVRGCHWLKDYFVSHPRDLQELPVCQQALKTSR
ncbi:eIF2A-related protein [Microcystis aeruginosa]|uniref:Protein TolB n=1 Tax=Microcystis aeruginosa NIES-4285 TaxID=2497681 RepID=A0A402DBJ7_MICAE|nr:AAA-like domain-containing protein [Microcystis aeruginosa]GCE59596.1 protein TolB [Microcystis aeruginosa NIES-4285]